MRNMTGKMLRGSALAALMTASFAAATPTPQAVRIRATIESVNGSLLDARARNGEEMKIKLTDNAPVNEVIRARRGDIQVDDYIAVTGMPQPDGSQMAVAILIFPKSMRGVAEGFRPWDLSPKSTMTNATVASKVVSMSGDTLAVKYKGGEQKIVVPDTAEIVTYKKASAADLKAGEKIFVAAAQRLPDGTLQAPNVAFGNYGVWR
jgi:hypothetical protein